MAGGALDILNSALRQAQGYESQGFDMGGKAYDGALTNLKNFQYDPRIGAGALAAGFLSPTKSGSWAEGFGKAAGNYTSVLEDQQKKELDRQEKMLAIQEAHAKLLQAHGANTLGFAEKRMAFPGQALNYKYDSEALNAPPIQIPRMDFQSGGPDAVAPATDDALPPAPLPRNVPTFARPGMPGASSSFSSDVPEYPDEEYLRSPVTPVIRPKAGPEDGPVMSDTMNPNVPPDEAARIRAMQQKIRQEYSPRADAGSEGTDALLGGSGADDLSGQPAAKPAADPNAKRRAWATQVLDIAAQNPMALRDPRFKAAYESANNMLTRIQRDEAAQLADQRLQASIQAQNNAAVAAAMRAKAEQAKADRENPDAKAAAKIKEMEAETEFKRMQELDQQAREGTKTRDIGRQVRAARDNLTLGPKWGTGKVGQFLNSGMERFGMDSGQAALGNAVGPLKAKILEAQNKGAVSDYDAQAADAQAPGVAMSEKSAKFAMELADMAADRSIEQAKFYHAWKDTYGHIGPEADAAWDRFTKENVLFTKDKDGNVSSVPSNIGGWDRYLKPQARTPQDATKVPGLEKWGRDKDGNPIRIQ